MFRFFLKKTNWVMWGGDLYDVSDAAWARKYLFLSRRQIVNRISQISSLVPADYTFLVKKTNYAGKQCRALYLNAYSYKFLASLKSNMPLKQSEELRVIIGNSATPSNRHKDIISGLAQIQNVKMRIYAPLSYGDPNYAKEIIAFGQKHLGDKFFPITDFMPPYEYAAFLSTMDMGVFYLDRQQALGNIYTLLFLEKAVLLNRTNPAWSFLEDELNVHLFDTEDFLSNLLLPVSCNSLAADNSRKISRLFDVDYLKTIWNENFAS